MKASLTLRIDEDQKLKYKAKAKEEGTNLSTVGRQLLDAWLSGQISLDTTIKVTNIKESE